MYFLFYILLNFLLLYTRNLLVQKISIYFVIFLNRGSLQLLQNNLNEGKIDLIKAQKIDPDNFEVHRQLNLLKYAVPETQHFLQTIKDKDGYIAHVEDVVKEKDEYAATIIKDKDGYIAHVEDVVKQKDDQLLQMIKDKDAYLEQALKDKDAYLEQALKDKDAYLEQAIKEYQDTIDQIRSSKSWRITHPFIKKNTI